MQHRQEHHAFFNQGYDTLNKRQRQAYGGIAPNGPQVSNAPITPSELNTARGHDENWAGEYAGWQTVEQFGLSQQYGYPSEAATTGRSSQAFTPSRDPVYHPHQEYLPYMESQIPSYQPIPVSAAFASTPQSVARSYPQDYPQFSVSSMQNSLPYSRDSFDQPQPMLPPRMPKNESLDSKFEWTLAQKKWLLEYRYRKYKIVFENFSPARLTQQWTALLSEFNLEFGIKVNKTQVTSQLQNMKKRYKLGLKRLEEGRNDLPPNWDLYREYFEEDLASGEMEQDIKQPNKQVKFEKEFEAFQSAPQVPPIHRVEIKIEIPKTAKKSKASNQEDRARSGSSIQTWKLILLDLYFRKYRAKFQNTEVGQKNQVWIELFGDLREQAGEIGIAMTGRNLQAHICNLRKKFEEGVEARQKGKAVPKDWELIKEYFEDEKKGISGGKSRERAAVLENVVRQDLVKPETRRELSKPVGFKQGETAVTRRENLDQALGTDRLDTLIEVALSELGSSTDSFYYEY